VKAVIHNYGRKWGAIFVTMEMNGYSGDLMRLAQDGLP